MLTKHDGSIYRFIGETRINNSEYGLHNWRSLELSEVSDMGWSDLEPVQGEVQAGDLCIISVLSGGDYTNSCAVEYANFLEWQELFVDSLSIDWWTVSGGYGSYGIAIRVDTDNSVILEMIASLSDYPVINDQRISEIEMQWQDEAWERDIASDFMIAINAAFDIDLDTRGIYQDNRVIDLFHECMERGNEYWIMDQHGSAYMDVDKLVQYVGYSDLAPFLLDHDPALDSYFAGLNLK